MPLGIEVGLSPGAFVFDGDPTTPRKKRTPTLHPICGPCLLWPNGWMDQDAILGLEVNIGPGDVMLDGVATSP